ncbi:P-loop containing nucleoside triphosphate hydrolase protein [Triangularia setosa]|uniref:P-loop containing nucleoside triphosphate hydrolase protein n=1 Tax=Triangularia setosa TaxID=2587417 RepID=A0AAN6W6Y5_9PEZI|nr:P-loop containing nucleoside triphosphate hydrolase protein [Podospora setosa]
MRGSSAGTVRWLLLSDLHFKHQDLDRVRQTAQWIVAEAQRNQVRRVVICGDLLTSRTMQPTHVLSACYRFISLLSDVVPRVHIVLGNHDLAYRRDYQTTALDALNIKRLAPYVSLHSAITRHEWDGRRVLLLPFREEQNELTEAVTVLCPNEARETVAFAHLAINKAITQRYVVGADVEYPRPTNSITYRGFTGPDRFASLGRTFTGHFHSHQTIIQGLSGSDKVDLRGSITYLGAPLQLNWADLYDKQRGVVLFDPETLKHELLINPHAVGYTTADLQQVLDGHVDKGSMKDKHVMLLGKLTHFKYAMARDKLLSLGVRSVRNWIPPRFAFHTGRPPFSGLGSSVPASDAAAQRLEEPTNNEAGLATITDRISGSMSRAEPQAKTRALDLIAEAREYVDSVDLNEPLLLRRDKLVQVGQRMIQASREIAGQDGEVRLNHQDFLENSSHVIGTKTVTELAGASTHIFVAEPHTLTITNFFGVRNTLHIDFRQDLTRGLIFLVGDNGSGKSTIIEAMVWCQFGRCIRSGLGVNDVINDNVGKSCSVRLEFANGYAITRYRRHKIHGNRVIVSLCGKPQPQLEHPDMRTTQAAINELLGTDYETYVRTVMLSHESVASFLTSTPTQRRSLIETSLGLSILDQCGEVLRLLLRDIDTDINEVEKKLEGVTRTMEYTERRLQGLDRTHKRLEAEAKKAVIALEAAIQDHASRQRHYKKEQIYLGLSMGFRAQMSRLQNQIHVEKENLQQLKGSYSELQEQMQAQKLNKYAGRTFWLGRRQEKLDKRPMTMAVTHPMGFRKLFRVMGTSILCCLSMAVGSLLGLLRTPTRDTRIIQDHDAEKINAQKHDQQAAIKGLGQDIEKATSRLQSLKQEEKQAVDHALRMGERLAEAIQAQEACEALRQQVMIKQRDAATYKHLVETEDSALYSLRSEHDLLASKLQELTANRELFAFWSSALAKRTPRISSSSSPRPMANTTANFREHILVKLLSELNTLLAQVLTVLHDDTRHANMATGMLRSLFDSDSDDIKIITSSSGPILDRKLALPPSLAYAKRSSGERKRVDLALFFTLLQLGRAGSAHRAHYLLVDEVFDNLDKAGQAAVVRWCSVMSQTTVGWIVVITHSQFLIEQDPGEEAAKVLVVTARMGPGGTELFTNGRSIGGG